MRFSVSGLWRGLTLACALLLLIPLASCTDEAKAATLDDLSIELLADSVRVTVGHTVDPRADSATVKVTIGTASQTRRAAQLTGSTAFVFAAPAEGATITIVAQVCAYRAPLAPVCAGKNRSWTRPVGPLPPPVIDTIDVGEVAAAIEASRLIQRTIVYTMTNDTCHVEQRDYYGQQLLVVSDSAPVDIEAQDRCEQAVIRVLATSRQANSAYPHIVDYNLAQVRLADSAYEGATERHRSYLDSMQLGLIVETTTRAELPRAYIDVWQPYRPPSPDTFVVRDRGSTGPELISIAEYRAANPGWTWP